MWIGAEVFVNFEEIDNPLKAVIEIADGFGVHGVFVTAPPVYKTAISFIGDRVSSMMCSGLLTAGSMVLGTDPCEFTFKNISIKAASVGSQSDTAAVLDFAKRRMLQQISEVYPFNRLPEGVERLRRGQVAGRIVVNFNWED